MGFMNNFEAQMIRRDAKEMILSNQEAADIQVHYQYISGGSYDAVYQTQVGGELVTGIFSPGFKAIQKIVRPKDQEIWKWGILEVGDCIFYLDTSANLKTHQDLPFIVTPMVRDTYISSQNTTLNFSTATNMPVGNFNAFSLDTTLRGLFKGDFSFIPINATILSVELVLTIVNGQGISTATPFSLYKVTTDYLTSTVTWQMPWTSPGGDFDPTPLQTVQVDGTMLPLVFNNATLKNALIDAIQNHSGLLKTELRGPENVGINKYINIASAEHTTVAIPKWTITYTIPVETEITSINVLNSPTQWKPVPTHLNKGFEDTIALRVGNTVLLQPIPCKLVR